MIAQDGSVIESLIAEEAAVFGGLSLAVAGFVLAGIGAMGVAYLLMTSHYMTVYIVNRTSLTFNPIQSEFYTGKLAPRDEIQKALAGNFAQIKPNDSGVVYARGYCNSEILESFIGIFQGLSGFIQYQIKEDGGILSIGMTNPIAGACKIGISCEAGEETYNNYTSNHSGNIYYKQLREGLYAKYSNTSETHGVATIELFEYDPQSSKGGQKHFK